MQYFIQIELARRKHIPIPEGWAMNDDGKVETNPDVAYQSGKLMPLGGSELNSGYKGYGLGMLVEVLCGILSGKPNYGIKISKVYKKIFQDFLSLLYVITMM